MSIFTGRIVRTEGDRRQMPNSQLNLRVLGYLEDGHWAAHCLEMDIVGFGSTFHKARKHLQELIEIQLGFAMYKNQPELLNHPAPARLFELYAQLHEACLRRYPEPLPSQDRAFCSIAMPKPHTKPPRFVLQSTNV